MGRLKPYLLREPTPYPTARAGQVFHALIAVLMLGAMYGIGFNRNLAGLLLLTVGAASMHSAELQPKGRVERAALLRAAALLSWCVGVVLIAWNFYDILTPGSVLRVMLAVAALAAIMGAGL